MLLGQSLEALQCEIVQKSPYKAQVNFCWKHQTELLLYHIQQNRYVDVPLLCAYLSFHHNELGQHRIIIAYKQKAPSPKAECVEKHSIFHRKGTLNQTVRDFVAARYRFANANIIFNFAVCFRRPRYRVFRYRKIFFMTAKTCSTLQRTDDF